MDRERKSGWLLAVMTGVLVAQMIVGVLYINRQVAASEQRDCSTLQGDIAAYAETPPATEAGLNQWRSKVNRYAEIRCEPVLRPELADVPLPRKENR